MIDQLFWSIFIFVTSFLLRASFPRKTRVAISISLLHSVLSWTLSKLTYVAYQKTLTYVILCYLIPESLSYAHPRIHIFFRHFCSGTSSINWRFARLTAVPFPVAILYTFVTSTSEKNGPPFFQRLSLNGRSKLSGELISPAPLTKKMINRSVQNTSYATIGFPLHPLSRASSLFFLKYFTQINIPHHGLCFC